MAYFTHFCALYMRARFLAGSQNRPRLFVVQLLIRISTKPIQMISFNGAKGLQKAIESRHGCSAGTDGV